MKAMTDHEYLQQQCDKCKNYTSCDVLDKWLEFWRANREMKEFILDGCDLAKCCTKFKKKVVLHDEQQPCSDHLFDEKKYDAQKITKHCSKCGNWIEFPITELKREN